MSSTGADGGPDRRYDGLFVDRRVDTKDNPINIVVGS
jgi:hypothetical protein